MAKILVIEDELKIQQIIGAYLVKEGFEVVTASDGAQGLESFKTEKPDLIILDLMLPLIPGEQILTTVRQVSEIPVIILSAKKAEEERIFGLNIGADDYLIKPFSPRELVARVKALLRRAQGRLAPVSLVPAAGGFAVDEAGQRILWQEQALALTPVEFRLLRQLLQHPGRVFERSQLLDLIHEDFRDVSDRVVDSHIKNIRRKLAALQPPQECIASVYGVGYRLDLS